MPIIQVRNDEVASLRGADQFQNAFESLHIPLGDFGIWNGQFEVASQRAGDLRPEGWEVTEDAAGSLIRDSVGACGRWCMRGGRAGVGTGGDITSLRYIPVYEISQGGRDYYIACAFSSDNGVGDARLGVHCYNSLKVFLATVWAISVANVPAGWVWHQRRVGPNGDVALPAGTRYVRVVVDLQYDAAATDYVYCDDVQFQQMKMAYSPGIRLMDGVIYDAGPRTFTLQAYTLWPGTPIALTFEEPGYLWFLNNFYVKSSHVRTQCCTVRIFIDGVGQNAYQLPSEPVATYLIALNFCGRSDGILAAGVHTVDVRLFVNQAGHTITGGVMSGYAFYVRAY